MFQIISWSHVQYIFLTFAGCETGKYWGAAFLDGYFCQRIVCLNWRTIDEFYTTVEAMSSSFVSFSKLKRKFMPESTRIPNMKCKKNGTISSLLPAHPIELLEDVPMIDQKVSFGVNEYK